MIQTLTGIEYLKCEIACKHDKTMEKQNWSKRISHFNFISLDDPDTFKRASNPVGLRAAVEAYHQGMKGHSTGYMITLDASSSGLQLLSLLVSCPISWQLCGGDIFNCVDSYATIYKAMDLHKSLTRSQVKDAIMTSFYGSTETPERVFKENLDVFYDTIQKIAPGAWDLNLSLQDLWDHVPNSTYMWRLPDNFHAGIETKRKEIHNFSFLGQDHKLTVEVDGRPDFHKGLGPNLIHSVDGMVVREMVRRCSYNIAHIHNIIQYITKNVDFEIDIHNKDRMVQTLWHTYMTTNFLSVRILDFLDSSNMNQVDTVVIAKIIQGMPADPFYVVTVHDCFRVHPNHGNDIRQQYNIIMADINDSKMLAFMCSDVAGRSLNARKIGVIDRQTILDGNYLLT